MARRAATIQADVRDARLRLLADEVAGVQRDLAEEQADERVQRRPNANVEEQLRAARSQEADLEERLQQVAPQLHARRSRSLDLARLRERISGLVALIVERRRSLEREQLEFSFGVDPEGDPTGRGCRRTGDRRSGAHRAAAQNEFERARDAARSGRS